MEIIDASRLRLRAKDKRECKTELIEARWNGGFKCPACGHKKGYWIRKRELFECANRKCKKQTSPTAGTQFHKMKSLEQLWSLFRCDGNRKAALTSGLVRERTGMSYSGGRELIQRVFEHRLSIPKRTFCSDKQSILFLVRLTRIE